MTRINFNIIKVLRKACQAATPAPWRVTPPNSVVGCALMAQKDLNSDLTNIGQGLSHENAVFAMTARAWMPRLLDVAEKVVAAQQTGSAIVIDMTPDVAELQRQLDRLKDALYTVEGWSAHDIDTWMNHDPNTGLPWSAQEGGEAA
ncbi:hypothetical protein [Hymenobacter sp. YC55]|uniref:hypothetical protein n=1 Tax=Hymenobacter sp. YC55 TaxID=3034019 RepID=UPI0023F9F0EA|nr:hypothetical protein [Hymenobacter sp. YC55]MDF7813630.1 hypothetical protein [Hymenobacter sp. YC55]